MPRTKVTPNTWIWTTAAMAALAWGLIGLVFASIAPKSSVPRVFYDWHVEHFAAFYVLAILAAAGLPRARLLWLIVGLVSLSLLLALVRAFLPGNRIETAEDVVADVAGILSAILPIVIGRFRQIAAQSAVQPH